MDEISVCEKDGYVYLVGSNEKYNNTMRFIITASKYVIFGGNSRGQNDIVKTEK